VDELTNTKNGRKDGQELIEKWKTSMRSMGRTAQYVTRKSQMDNVNIAETDHLWGLYERGSQS